MRRKLMKQVLGVTHDLLRLKARDMTSQLRRRVAVEIHAKQFEVAENRVQRALTTYFRQQIRHIAKQLRELGDTRTVNQVSDQAQTLQQLVFDPNEWTDKLIDRVFPVLARSMGEAGMAQLRLMEFANVRTTATEWLEQEGEELPPGLSADLPPWMSEAIEVQLRDTFSQPYWQEINQTTARDIQGFLQNGLDEGWSIRKMATEISDAFPADYGRTRATLVARTEVPHALNSSRKLSIEKLKEDVGPEVPIKMLWISVLAATTRESHAALHEVEADENGMWNLGGIDVPWPGHTSLPAGDRCNCFPSGVPVQGNFCGAQRAWYEGIFSEIVFRSGRRVTMTPNHPVVTKQGLVPAGKLKPSDQVMTYGTERDTSILVRSSSDQLDNEPVPIEQVFETFLKGASFAGRVVVRSRSEDDFYGDGKSIQGKIEIVRTYWKLLRDGKFGQFQKCGNSIFISKPEHLLRKSGSSAGSLPLVGIGVAPTSSPSSSQGLLNVLRRLEITPAGSLSIGVAADFDACLLKSTVQDGSGIAGFLREAKERYARFVAFDDVVEVRNFYSAGHVYDLQSVGGTIIAHDPHCVNTGIVTSNCLCTIVSEIGDF